MNKTILTTTFFFIFFGVSGMILVKLGGDSIELSLQNEIYFKIGYITLIGLILYILSFVLWQRLIIISKTSILVPITTGISQILILLAGYYIFQENINTYSILGIILIITGIFLVNLKENINSEN